MLKHEGERAKVSPEKYTTLNEKEIIINQSFSIGISEKIKEHFSSQS